MIKRNLLIYLILIFISCVIAICFDWLAAIAIILLILIVFNLAGFVYSVIKIKKIWAIILQFLVFAGILYLVFFFGDFNHDVDINTFDEDLLYPKIPLPVILILSNGLSCFTAYLVHWLEDK